MLHKLAKFHHQIVFMGMAFNKKCFMFHASAFEDAMTFEHLKS